MISWGKFPFTLTCCADLAAVRSAVMLPKDAKEESCEKGSFLIKGKL